MNIAIYYPWIHLTSGSEKTILDIATNIKHDFTIFTNHYSKENTFPEFKRLKVIELKKVPVKRNLYSVLKAAIIIFFQKIDLEKFDLFFVHSDGIADLIMNRNRKINTLCFCHTPLRPVFDTKYRKISIKNYKGLSKIMYKIFSAVFKKIDQKMWKQYKKVIFSSKETFLRAKRGGLLKKNTKHKIVHPGVYIKKIKLNKNKGDYFLVPGRIKWTKNIELAIKSFILFDKNNPNNKFKLIISGQLNKYSKNYYENLLLISNNSKKIKFIISPSFKKLSLLYKNCYAAIIPSFNEDWGIVALEANSYGKPTICVKSGGIKEQQINKKTGLLVKEDVNEFAKSIEKMVKNPDFTFNLGKNAYTNAKRFDQKLFINQIETELLKLDTLM